MYDVKISELEGFPGGKSIEIAGESVTVRVECFKLRDDTSAFRVSLLCEGKETAVIAAVDGDGAPAVLKGVDVPMPKACA